MILPQPDIHPEVKQKPEYKTVEKHVEAMPRDAT